MMEAGLTSYASWTSVL